MSTCSTPTVTAAADAPPAVIGVHSSGPLYLPGSRITPRTAAASLFTSAIDRPLGIRLLTAGGCWGVAAAGVAWWWVRPSHISSPGAFLLNTLLLAVALVLPAIFLSRLMTPRRVRREAPVPAGARVAFVVTKAPSEPWVIARETLQAMLQQNCPLPYDVWLCDERPTSAVARWCGEHGVQLLSREGISEYHQPSWPKRTRCKEGNLAYFYDQVGYANYDLVCQLDCDHIPAPGYLTEMLRPFSDPAVGYVAAPSVCDTNAQSSWAARGRLHAEAVFHGVYQMSHNGGGLPIAIGSHYAVRTRALHLAGGLGPELAEDYSTSYLIRQAGYDGVFAIDAHARGAGPQTFADMVTQEFQWTRSLVVLGLGVVRRTLHRLPLGNRIRLSFAASFNSLFGLLCLAGVLLPPVAALRGEPFATVNILHFLIALAALNLPLLTMTSLVRRAGLLRPYDAPVISWESVLYNLSRWPYLVWGTIAGILQVLTGTQRQFRVTPKGNSQLVPLPVGLVLPSLTVAVGCLGAGVYGTYDGALVGYTALSLCSGIVYSTVAVMICLLHAHEQRHVTNAGVLDRLDLIALPVLISLLCLVASLLAGSSFLSLHLPIMLAHAEPLPTPTHLLPLFEKAGH